MKTVTQPSVISPSILILALLAALVIFVGVTGKKVPLLSNLRADSVLLVVLGMAICQQGGIGRIAAAVGILGQAAWWRTLAIGASIVSLVAVALFVD
jgi:hypothetical protein